MRLTTAVTGVLKIVAGVVALATLRSLPGRGLRRILRLLLWGVGILYALYGLLGFGEKVLMALDILDVPDGFGEDAVWWYLFWWEPFWMLGGALFLLTAWRFGRAVTERRGGIRVFRSGPQPEGPADPGHRQMSVRRFGPAQGRSLRARGC